MIAGRHLEELPGCSPKPLCPLSFPPVMCVSLFPDHRHCPYPHRPVNVVYSCSLSVSDVQYLCVFLENVMCVLGKCSDQSFLVLFIK